MNTEPELQRITDVKAPPPIDPKEHEQHLLALRLLEPLGMAWAHHPPTPGLMSYLHDPARRPFQWQRRVEYGSE